MQPLKIRFWHQKQQRMYSPEMAAELKLAVLPTTGGVISLLTGETMPLDVMIPLPFTGLLDGARREIYDGDIVSMQRIAMNSGLMPSALLYQVIWNPLRCAWFMKADQNLTGVYLTSGSMEEAHYRREVVGNIFQHSHLLQPATINE